MHSGSHCKDDISLFSYEGQVMLNFYNHALTKTASIMSNCKIPASFTDSEFIFAVVFVGDGIATAHLSFIIRTWFVTLALSLQRSVCFADLVPGTGDR